MHSNFNALSHAHRWLVEDTNEQLVNVLENEPSAEQQLAGDAETQRLHAEHLSSMRELLDLKLKHLKSDELFLEEIQQFEDRIKRDLEEFARLTPNRPKLQAIAEQWIAENNRMLEAYAEMRRFLDDGNAEHFDQALAIIQQSLNARAPLYAAFL